MTISPILASFLWPYFSSKISQEVSCSHYVYISIWNSFIPIIFKVIWLPIRINSVTATISKIRRMLPTFSVFFTNHTPGWFHHSLQLLILVIFARVFLPWKLNSSSLPPTISVSNWLIGMDEPKPVLHLSFQTPKIPHFFWLFGVWPVWLLSITVTLTCSLLWSRNSLDVLCSSHNPGNTSHITFLFQILALWIKITWWSFTTFTLFLIFHVMFKLLVIKCSSQSSLC